MVWSLVASMVVSWRRSTIGEDGTADRGINNINERIRKKARGEIFEPGRRDF